MKKLFAVLCGICMLTAGAGERENLLKTFARENAAAENEFQSANTTIELVGGAGNLCNIAESQLYRALDYKLRHSANAAERLQLLKNFHELSKEVQNIYLTPRENQGVLIGMRIYHKIAVLIQQRIAVLLLDTAAESRWEKIAAAKLHLNGEKIRLADGKAAFFAKKFDQKEKLELCLFPENTFTYNERNFAIIRTDIPLAGNDDYSSVYLCELKNGGLQVHSAVKMPYFTKWKLQGRKLVISGQNSVSEEFEL